jgi:hypothetical protein
MADQQYTKRLLSADSHVMEPRDLWEKRIDAKWRDKAPRIEMLDESGDYIVIDEMRPPPRIQIWHFNTWLVGCGG